MLLLAAIPLLVAGCGSEGITATRASGPVDFAGIAFETSTAVTFAGGRAGSVMIDGLNDDGGTAHVRVRFAPADGGGMKIFDDDEAGPLDGIGAWLSGQDLIIAGGACPHWSRAAALKSSDGVDMRAICGEDREVVLRLNLGNGEWTTIDDDLDPAKSPYFSSFGDSPYALAGTNLDARMFPDGRIESLDASALPAAADASETACVGPNGAMTSAMAANRDNSGLGTFVLEGTKWQKMDSKEADGFWVSHECTAGGLVMVHVAPDASPSYELLALASDGTPTKNEISPPPIATTPRIPVISVDAAGLLLATNPDDGTTYALQDGRWQRLQGSIPDGVRSKIVLGNQVNWIDSDYSEPSKVSSMN